jgi:hypothetical protein
VRQWRAVLSWCGSGVQCGVGAAVKSVRQLRGLWRGVSTAVEWSQYFVDCGVELVRQRSGVDAAVALSQCGCCVHYGVGAAVACIMESVRQWRALWSRCGSGVESVRQLRAVWCRCGSGVESVRQWRAVWSQCGSCVQCGVGAAV